MKRKKKEKMSHTLKKYFGKEKNIETILRKTSGTDQKMKIYQILCILENPSLDSRIQIVNESLKSDSLMWNHSIFQKERAKIDEENEFITCPYELSDGVLQCKKCGCCKIFSFSKQTRSIDEPMTVFARCSKCCHKWCEGS